MTQLPATHAELIEVFGEPVRETSCVSRKEFCLAFGCSMPLPRRRQPPRAYSSSNNALIA
jgi:hypothetical protein